MNVKRTPIKFEPCYEPTVENPYGYIYLTTDSKTHRFYIGKKETNKFDKTYFGSGTLLVKALNVRPDAFTCKPIDWALNKQELNEKEQYWIKFCEALSDIDKPFSERAYYNILSGGDGGRLSGESLEKMKKSRIGKCMGEDNPNWKGKSFTPESIEKIRQFNLGRKASEETKAKMSKSQKGKKMPEEAKEKIRLSHIGMKASEETKAKISKNRTGKLMGSNHPLARPVVRLSMSGRLIQEYECISSVPRSNQGFLSQEDIRRCCKGRQKQYKGFKWMYLEDYNKLIGKE